MREDDSSFGDSSFGSDWLYELGEDDKTTKMGD